MKLVPLEISSCLIDETDVPHDITPRGLKRAPLVYDRADDGSNGEAEISVERTVEAEVDLVQLVKELKS